MYQQATRSNAGTMGLLFIFLLDIIVTVPGAYITCGRTLWTLGRDDATPFSAWVGRVHPRWRNQFNATLVCGGFVTILGVIYIGSATAFNAFLGVFTIFTTMSYLMAILPHILSRRRYVRKGPFWMSAPVAYTVTGTASAYIIVWVSFCWLALLCVLAELTTLQNVIYMFPYSLPVSAPTMNYACVMSGGITMILAVLYMWKRKRGYVGPEVVQEASDDIVKGLVLTGTELEKDRRRSSARRLSAVAAGHGSDGL